MPKASSAPYLPLNGIFPIEKPSGPTSMRVLDQLTNLLCDSKLFDDPEKLRHADKKSKKKGTAGQGLKIGQGGTLDPLADGVLVVGVNRGTKHLQQYLSGTKEYESVGILGASTTTMDCEGPVLTTGNFDNVTREDIEKHLAKFQGEIDQVPPIFSALKQDGKPLYEYARENKPLPRPIASRKVQVKVDLVDFMPATRVKGDGGHSYRWPEQRLSEEEKTVFRRLTQMVAESSNTDRSHLPDIKIEDFPETSAGSGLRPPTFKIRMTVSGGTYVRSIVHDLGVELGCGAHVVQLRRTRQGRFALRGEEETLTEETRTRLRNMIETAEDRKTAQVIDEEECATNAADDKGVGSQEETMEDSAVKGLGIPSGPSTGCVPWSVWERALEEREQSIAADKAAKEELLANGASEQEVRKAFSYAARREKRLRQPLKEWEMEMLRRFVAVPVPVAGKHNKYRW